MIRNAVVKKAVPKDVGFSASNAKALRTTTGESLLNNSNITNVQRLNRPANDNSALGTSVITRRKFSRVSNDSRLKPASFSQVKQVATNASDTAMAASAAWFIVGTTWILYLVQFVFAVVSLAGLAGIVAVEDGWVGYLNVFGLLSDTAENTAYLGMGITTVMGIFTLIIAIAIFLFRGVDIAKGHSVPLMAICFALNAVPGTSLVPWIWLWCLYVVKSQINK